VGSLGSSGPNLKPGTLCVCCMNGLRRGMNTTQHPPSPASRAGTDLPTNVQAVSRAVSYVNTHRLRFQVRARTSQEVFLAGAEKPGRPKGGVKYTSTAAPACADAEPAHRQRLEANALLLPGVGGWVQKKPTRVAASSPRASLGRGVQYADARSSVCRRVQSVAILRLERYGGVRLLLQQRSKHPREMILRPKASKSNLSLCLLFVFGRLPLLVSSRGSKLAMKPPLDAQNTHEKWL